MGLTKCRERLNERTRTAYIRVSVRRRIISQQPFGLVSSGGKKSGKEIKSDTHTKSLCFLWWWWWWAFRSFSTLSRSIFFGDFWLVRIFQHPPQNVSRLDSPNTFKSGCHSLLLFLFKEKGKYSFSFYSPKIFVRPFFSCPYSSEIVVRRKDMIPSSSSRI